MALCIVTSPPSCRPRFDSSQGTKFSQFIFLRGDHFKATEMPPLLTYASILLLHVFCIPDQLMAPRIITCHAADTGSIPHRVLNFLNPFLCGNCYINVDVEPRCQRHIPTLED